jgi:hypothetical protein
VDSRVEGEKEDEKSEANMKREVERLLAGNRRRSSQIGYKVRHSMNAKEDWKDIDAKGTKPLTSVAGSQEPWSRHQTPGARQKT